MAPSQQVRNFEKRMAAIPVALKAELFEILRKNADELADGIRQLAEEHRLTGALIESIRVTPPGQRTPDFSLGGGRVAGELEFVVSVGDHEVRYGHLLEYGTANAPAYPFFWPAVRALQKRMRNRLNRGIRQFLKRWSA